MFLCAGVQKTKMWNGLICCANVWKCVEVIDIGCLGNYWAKMVPSTSVLLWWKDMESPTHFFSEVDQALTYFDHAITMAIYIYMRPGVSLNWLHHQNGSFSEMELVGPQFSETHLLVTGLTTSCPWSFWLCASFYNTPAPMLMAMAPHRLRLPSLPETLRWARSLRQLKRVYQRISTMTSPFFRTIWVPAPPSSAWGKIAGLNMG